MRRARISGAILLEYLAARLMLNWGLKDPVRVFGGMVDAKLGVK